MSEKVSKEVKLMAVKDIVANYVRNENNKASIDDICELFSKLYRTVEKELPEPEKHRVGLA